MTSSWLWVVFTVIAAFMQTLRNAMQRELTGKLGTVGATHVRFLFGFPFVIVFLLGVMLATGASLPRPGLLFWPWAILGAFAQVAATALMLAAMGERSFVVTIAYIKTEPIQVAVFGLSVPRRHADGADDDRHYRRHLRRGDHVDKDQAAMIGGGSGRR